MRTSLHGLWRVVGLLGGVGCGSVNAPADSGAGAMQDARGPDAPAADAPGPAIDAPVAIDAPPPPLCAAPVNPPTTQRFITLFADADGHTGPARACQQVGSLLRANNPHYVFCKRFGAEVGDGARFNHWWLWTELDGAGAPFAWIPAYFLLGQGNDQANDNNGQPIPDCP